MKPKILLVNPSVYDFTAYDFWIRPYGLLSVGGMLRDRADLSLFDYLDRSNLADGGAEIRQDRFGRGKFASKRVKKPEIFGAIPRYFRRFGADRSTFERFLNTKKPFDFVLIQSVMTYWYPGVAEVIEDVRRLCPGAKIVLGGVYATLCPDHARSLGADLVIEGSNLAALADLLEIEGLTEPVSLLEAEGRRGQPSVGARRGPYWEGYERLDVGVMKLTSGCPFACSYCSVPQTEPGFSTKPLDDCIADLHVLCDRGAANIAFYDDALLHEPERLLEPFLGHVIDSGISVNFHTPNGLHARFITADLARLMVRGGFKTFYLGFESCSEAFQRQTGAKVLSRHLAEAVENLLAAGANRQNIIAYEILGHPESNLQELEQSIRFANGLGIRVMLSDFSPIPGTPDGEKCRKWIDLDEPLNHNKTAFPATLLGFETASYFKTLCNDLNKQL